MKTPRLLLLPLVLTLAGCASISVEQGRTSDIQTQPDKVYVDEFSTAKGEFNVDRDGAELKDFKADLSRMMVVGITTDLSKRLIAAVPSDGNNHAGAHAWLIHGEFVRVNQGSRLLRGAIGFGLGATKLETKVRVYDLSTGEAEPFLTFFTTGGSNAEPGAITAIATDPLTIAVEAVAGGMGNVAHGVTEDTMRTSREITAELSDYMYHQGWIPKDKWIEPKTTKDLPLLKN
jgi:hypothetical protein